MNLLHANAAIVAEVCSRKHVGESKKRFRTFKLGSASDAIGKLEGGDDIYCLTFGQFSLIDLLCATLQQTGPADVDIATWIAAQADLDVVEELLGRASINSFRLLVDRSFVRMKPQRCKRIEEMFGAGCIRSLNNHAKFIRIKNEKWNISIRTSMNLNQNPRMENFELTDDPTLCEFLKRVVDDVFEEHPPGDFDCGTPAIKTLENTKRNGDVPCGQISFDDTPQLQKLRGEGQASFG